MLPTGIIARLRPTSWASASTQFGDMRELAREHVTRQFAYSKLTDRRTRLRFAARFALAARRDLPQFFETRLVHAGAVINHPNDCIVNVQIVGDNVDMLRFGVVGIGDQFSSALFGLE